MKALSIRQPWAWLIVYGGKDIENRDWSTKFRGPFLIHAGQGMTTREYGEVRDFLQDSFTIKLPRPEALARGGIIGRAEVVDCVSHSASPWFFGDFGFKLANPKPLPFIPYRGQLGWFDVPDSLIKETPNG